MLSTLMISMWAGIVAGETPITVQQSTAQKQEDAKELKVLARANWPYGKADPEAVKKGEQVVIRNPTELIGRSPWSELDAVPQVVEKMAVQAVAKLLNVPDIDWNKQMLVVVTAGPRPTGGWKVNIDSLKVSGKALTVEWSVAPPKGIATQAFTHPGQVILVERVEGSVTFVLRKPGVAK
jgi:PrcB C-terminal